MTAIRILLVDDHAVVRSGLSKFLLVNKDLQLVGEASDGAEAIQMAGLHKPDVILMDLMMPGMDGITATRRDPPKIPAHPGDCPDQFLRAEYGSGRLASRGHRLPSEERNRGRARERHPLGAYRAHDAFSRSCPGACQLGCPAAYPGQ